jgi:hypothetical protein
VIVFYFGFHEGCRNRTSGVQTTLSCGFVFHHTAFCGVLISQLIQSNARVVGSSITASSIVQQKCMKEASKVPTTQDKAFFDHDAKAQDKIWLSEQTDGKHSHGIILKYTS